MAAKQADPHSKPSFKRKAGRIMFIILSILLALILIPVVTLLILSPGKPNPILDQNGAPVPGSLSEKVFVNINGIQQGMFIQSSDPSNPVLLYLHGGMPDYFLTEKYPTGLENDFTVVWWDQRGSGLSYQPDIPAESKTLKQMIADTHAVTNYLRGRFGKEKIYLMGHSGGSFIGIQAVAQAPELYFAYIGMAQMSNQLESERLAYDYMLQQFKTDGNTQMVRKLENAPVTTTNVPRDYLLLRDGAMHSLGIGTMRNMNSVITGIFLPSLASPQYTFSEKLNLWRGKSQSGVAVLWQDMVTTDLSKKLTEIDVPVYFLHGVYDYTVSYPLAKAYFETLIAPIKGFYSFEQSAHSPFFEEPEKVQQIFREDVLTGGNGLADLK